MFNRMMVALATALALVGPFFAQAPTSGEPVPFLAPVSESITPATPLGFWNGAGPTSRGQFWGAGDFLIGFFNGSHLPPLVTTSPAGTDRALAGVLGAPNTNLLFGHTVNQDARFGYRFEAGYWFDTERTLGIEVGVTLLESQSTLFNASSDGSTILARPYVNALTGVPEAVLIAFPGSSAGLVDVRASSGNYYETHIDLSENILDKGWFQLDTLLGYRFYRYDEGLRVQQIVLPTDPKFVAGTKLTATDSFVVHNQFHGGDFGLRTHFSWGDFSLSFLTKLAVGRVHRDVKIQGSQVIEVPGTEPVIQTGGVLALSSNIGRYSKGDWALMPEFGPTLSWQVRPNLAVRIGYTLLCLGRAARASDQVDVTVNPNLFPPASQDQSGVNRPAFVLNRTDIWFQSINLGMEFSY